MLCFCCRSHFIILGVGRTMCCFYFGELYLKHIELNHFFPALRVLIYHHLRASIKLYAFQLRCGLRRLLSEQLSLIVHVHALLSRVLLCIEVAFYNALRIVTSCTLILCLDH